MLNFAELWIYTDFLQNQNQNFAAKQILALFIVFEKWEFETFEKATEFYLSHYHCGSGNGYGEYECEYSEGYQSEGCSDYYSRGSARKLDGIRKLS